MKEVMYPIEREMRKSTKSEGVAKGGERGRRDAVRTQAALMCEDREQLGAEERRLHNNWQHHRLLHHVVL